MAELFATCDGLHDVADAVAVRPWRFSRFSLPNGREGVWICDLLTARLPHLLINATRPGLARPIEMHAPSLLVPFKERHGMSLLMRPWREHLPKFQNLINPGAHSGSTGAIGVSFPFTLYKFSEICRIAEIFFSFSFLVHPASLRFLRPTSP